MALSWLEGFESYGTASGETLDAALIAQGYSHANLYSAPTTYGQLVDGPFYGKALQWVGSTSISTRLRKAISNTATFILGFAFKHSGLSQYYTSYRLLEFIHPNGDTQCSLWMYADGTLFFRRGTVTYLTKIPNSLASNTWHYVEIKINISNTGYIIVRVNGSEILNVTSLDTQNESTSDMSYIDFSVVQYACFDDIYFCDDNGGDPSFLGPLTIENLQPTSDSVASWDTIGGVNHYDVVDNQPADDASYVVGDTLNEYDLYGYEDLQIIDTGIIGVAQTTRVCTSNAGVRKLKTLCYSGSTLETTSELVFSGATEFEPVDAILTTDPDTSVAWTPSGLNSATFGVRVGD